MPAADGVNSRERLRRASTIKVRRSIGDPQIAPPPPATASWPLAASPVPNACTPHVFAATPYALYAKAKMGTSLRASTAIDVVAGAAPCATSPAAGGGAAAGV